MSTLPPPVEQLSNLGYDLVAGASRFDVAMSMDCSILARDDKGIVLQICCKDGKVDITPVKDTEKAGGPEVMLRLLARSQIQRHYRGFEFDWNVDTQTFTIMLEGEPVAQAETVEIGRKCVDFFHEASSVSFSLHQKRSAQRRQEEQVNAGPEPELAKLGRPNVPWVKWYRAITGCSLSEAHAEACRRIANC